MEASFPDGAVLLREADRMSGLTDRAARSLTDTRRKASCRHSLLTMVRQRVYALALGYEDPDDHDELRLDPALQTAVDVDEPLAGARRTSPGAGNGILIALRGSIGPRLPRR